MSHLKKEQCLLDLQIKCQEIQIMIVIWHIFLVYNRLFVHRIRGDVELAAADLETAQRLTQPETPTDPETIIDNPLRDELIFQR